MKLLNICNRIIEYGFYALFLLVPLAFTSKTSELFELNKMWLTWALAIIIAMSWFIKIILQKKLFIKRTPLDIPIVLFLFSQLISTIFSLDPHTSFWGYYSRFNGGLLSIISYIFLYYAFLSNFQTNAVAMVKKSLFLTLASGLIVALWGLPSHFGYDPTCFLFRGTFDVSCWTADFLPKVRIFSTLGQPNWLAAYLAILMPIAIAFFINKLKSSSSANDKEYRVSGIMYYVSKKYFILDTLYLILIFLFYVDLLFTRSHSGFIGVWGSLIFFTIAYYWFNGRPKISLTIEKLKSPVGLLVAALLIITFIVGTPFGQLNKFTLEGIGSYFQKLQAPKTMNKPEPTLTTPAKPIGMGITESGDLRLPVWEGALNTWKDHPIFGTGVETFAFAYYKYKPIGQNLTSEWNFLYNKAHNEYLNYLATTGIFGLGTYLLMIGFFLTTVILNLFQDLKSKSNEMLKLVQHDKNKLLILALLAAYLSILITNFFGFSVVITNIYLFMIPAFVFILSNTLKTEKTAQPARSVQSVNSSAQSNLTIWQWTPIFFIFGISCILLVALFRFWLADIAYALGNNLDLAGEYQQAYPYLHKAVGLRGGEPVFKNELSINNAFIAAGLASQKLEDSATKEQVISVASSLAQEAINTSNEVISQYQNNAVFWKTRTRLFYVLSQVDSRYLPRALDSIIKASLLAPNDANIWYNLGVLYGQNNNLEKGIETLEKTIILKPDYREAHYALGLFYHTASLDNPPTGGGKVVIDENLNQKAIAQMQYILDKISPKDADALKSIEDWTK